MITYRRTRTSLQAFVIALMVSLVLAVPYFTENFARAGAWVSTVKCRVLGFYYYVDGFVRADGIVFH